MVSSGTIQADQKLFTDNFISVNIKVTIRSVTIKGDSMEQAGVIPPGGANELINEIQWKGVEMIQ